MGKKIKLDKKYIKFIGNILVIISLLFLIRKFNSLNINIKEYLSKSNVVIALILSLIFSLLLSIQSLPWILLIRRICNIKLPFYDGNKTYCKSSLLKYIPGNIFQYVGRSSLIYQFENITYSCMLSSIIIETLCVIASAFVVSLVFSWSNVIEYFYNHVYLIYVIILPLLITFSLSIILRNKIKLITKKLKLTLNKGLLYDVFLSVLYFSFILIIQGGMLTIIINQLNNTPLFNNLIIILGTYSFSWVIGYITPGVSGGIGVREALLCLFLRTQYPESIILVSVIIYRILNIIGDLGAYLLSSKIGKNL